MTPTQFAGLTTCVLCVALGVVLGWFGGRRKWAWQIQINENLRSASESMAKRIDNLVAHVRELEKADEERIREDAASYARTDRGGR